MSLFQRAKGKDKSTDQAELAEMALKYIHDGVIITDKAGIVKFINPAAATMAGTAADKAMGFDYGLVLRLESKEGRELSEAENPLIQAMKTGQALEKFQGCLIVGQTDKRIPIAISVLPEEDAGTNRVITFRDITKELEEEGEQMEFISTASHEMRTPVATIDGYLSLAINPQTATIDERARGYLTAAQAASKHLGKLFQDLLDTTKLDDGRIKPHFVPTEMVELIGNIANDYIERAKENKINFRFGSDQPMGFGENRRIEQVVYGFVDIDFMREIMDNMIDNALKYTPSGGSIYVNVRGDGDRILINVTDTGMGISPDDLSHVFQKFYRADNSDTRTIGGTGLGLYLVKQRVEAMGGRVWAESAFGEGSTFYVSLPRITSEEYEKRMIVVRNQQMQEQAMKGMAPAGPQPNQPMQAFDVAAAKTNAPAAPTAPNPVPTTPAPTAPTTPAPAPKPAQAPVPAAPAPVASAPTSAPKPTPATPSTPQTPANPPAPPTAPPAPPAPPTPPTPQPPKQIDINLNGERK